jgi:hypothetical protein
MTCLVCITCIVGMVVLLKITKGEVELKTSKHFDYFLYVTNLVQLGLCRAPLQNITWVSRVYYGGSEFYCKETRGQSQVIYK